MKTRKLKAFSGKKALGAAIVLVALIGIGIALFEPGELRQAFIKLMTRLQEAGTLGAALFIIIYIACAVFVLPASIITLGAGAVYGVLEGTVLVLVASTIAAMAPFFIARYLAHDKVDAWLSSRKRLRRIQQAVGKEGFQIVLLTRLSPLFPYNVLNYFYGLTEIKTSNYFLATFLGMLPGTVLYVYIGSLVGELSGLNNPTAPRTKLEWLMYAVGLTATVFVSVKVSIIARGALSARGVEDNEEDESI